MVTKPGYHIADIKHGTLGELSKIQEELDELKDAETQGIRVMQLVELSDLIGAVSAYLVKHSPDFTLNDLVGFTTVTARAFKNGHRK